MWMTSLMAPDADTTLDLLLPDGPPALPRLDTGDTTSSATDSGVDAAPEADPAPVAKKRKATYYVRKDAIETLQDQVKVLEAELARARSTSTAELREAQTRTLQYERGIERNNLMLAGSDSVLSAYKLSLSAASTVPLRMYVHLPADPEGRNQVLGALYGAKIDASRRFMAERTRHLDPRIPHKQEDRFQLPNGDIISVGSDVTPFTSGHSVKQVYDAFMFFVTYQEISISERLGVLTIRENEDIVDFKYGQTRLLSTLPGDIEIESNNAMFAAFWEANDGEPASAVAAMDFVDKDDLYPYRPETCGRKELTTAVSIVETISETGRVVSLCKWGHIRLRVPVRPLSEKDMAAVHDTMHGLSNVMVKVMKERLATQEPQP